MENLNQIVMMAHSPNSTENRLEPNKEEVTTHIVTGNNDIVLHSARVEDALKYVAGEAYEATGLGHVVKRGRGRPQKHKINESQLAPLTAQPLDFTVQPYGRDEGVKRSRGHPRGSRKPQIPNSIKSVGRRFTSHLVDVSTGEDVIRKIAPFYEMGTLAVSVLSANGPVSSVAFLQPGSNNLLRYEGNFKILSLTGSCAYSTEIGVPFTKNCRLTISLVKPHGEIFGGHSPSSLVAAGHVRLMLATFKQTISNQIKRRQPSESSTDPNIPSNLDSAGGVLHKVPRMAKEELLCPTPISIVRHTTPTNGITNTPILKQ